MIGTFFNQIVKMLPKIIIAVPTKSQ